MTGRRTALRLLAAAHRLATRSGLATPAGGGYRAVARTTSVFGRRHLDMATAERR